MRLPSAFLIVCLVAATLHAQVPTVYRVAGDYRSCEIRSTAVGPDGSLFTVTEMDESTTVKRFSATGTELWATNLDRELAVRITTGSLHAHEAGVDLLVQSLQYGDTVKVYQLSLAGDVLGTVSLADAKAGRPTFSGLYADEHGYILTRFSIDPAYRSVLNIHDRTGVLLKREETKDLSGGPSTINRVGEDIILIHPSHLLFTSLQPGAKTLYLTREELGVLNSDIRAGVPVEAGVQFLADDPGNLNGSIKYTVKYDGTSYTVSSAPSSISSRIYRAYAWGVDSIAYANIYFEDVTFEVRSLTGEIGRSLTISLRDFNLEHLANRNYGSGKALYGYRSARSAAGTQGKVLSFLPARPELSACSDLPELGEFDYPVATTLQLADGSVLATQSGRPVIIKLEPDGSKSIYAELRSFPEGTTISTLLAVGTGAEYISCSISYPTASGAPRTSVVVLNEGHEIKRTDFNGHSSYFRKLERWEGGGSVLYVDQGEGREKIYVQDSLGTVVGEYAVGSESRASKATSLLEVLSVSFGPGGSLVVVTLSFNNLVGGVIFDVQVIKDGAVVNGYSGNYGRPGTPRSAQFLRDGRLLLTTANRAEGGRDSMYVVGDPTRSFLPQEEYVTPWNAVGNRFYISNSTIVFKAAKYDVNRPQNAELGILTFDLGNGRVVDSLFVRVSARHLSPGGSVNRGSARPGLFAYPLPLGSNPVANAIAMVGTKSSAIRERTRRPPLAVTNPFTDAIYFATPVLPKGVTLCDALGRNHALTPVTELADGRYVTRPLQSLPAGLYVLNVDGSSRVLIHQ